VRVHRVFVRALQAGEVVLSGGEAHHLAQVLRVQPGVKVCAFDGQGSVADGEVLQVEPMRVTLALGEPEPSEVEAAMELTLAVALLKGDKLAEVVRRGTELGVARFQPFVSARCDVRELSRNKLERCQRVAQEAAKQSGRSVVPVVEEVRPLGALELPDLTLVAHPTASETLRETLERHPDTRRLVVLTGPEGGLTEEEVAALERRGAQRVYLGPRILRAETAPVALAAALLVPEAL